MHHSRDEPTVYAGRFAALACLAALAFVFAAAAQAQAPPGYYDTVDATNPTTLRQTLHAVIKDHIRFPYTSTNTDTWDILNLADEDPGNPGNIIDIYKNASYAKISGGTGAYNREHTWAKSYGFPNDGTDNYPYTDCHHLFLSDSGYNSSRSNKPFRYCSAACSENPTDVNDGRGGGTGVYPGNSNWTTGSFTAGTWETWSGRRGDSARAIFYMDLRYEGGFHGVTGIAEPDLIVTDNEALIDASNTGANEPVAYMGMLSDLLLWHDEDPVDSRELHHTDAVYSFQGNRNPFVDHPEWVDCLYRALCGGGGDTTPPAAPTGLAATPGDGTVSLAWDPNGEPDLGGYNVFRGTSPGGPYSQLNGALVGTNAFVDGGVTNGTTYYYVVSAVDTSSNESGLSNEASATPQGGGGTPGAVILSEVFYDPSGSDDGLEWVELFNSGGTAVDLSTYSLGNGGTDYTYSKAQLSGTILPGQTFVVGGPTSSSLNAFPAFDLVVNFNPDFQNSGTTADGVALFDVPAAQVNASTVPIDAVVYGGSNTSGLIDETGFANPPEVGDAPDGSSIERTDLTGSWRIQSAPTPNVASDLAGGGGGDTTPPAAPAGLSATPGDATVSLDWSDNAEPDLAGYNVYRATTNGGPYAQVNGALLTASAFADGGVVNGTTYFYVVTAVDTSANESADSNEVSATPQAPGGPTTMHVSGIVVTTVGGSRVRGQAIVTLVDDLGNPVSAATVDGTFSGSYSESQSAATDASGVATLTTSSRKKPPVSFTFCVDAASHASLAYDPAANAVTCASF